MQKLKNVTTAEYTRIIMAKLSDLNAEIWYTSGLIINKGVVYGTLSIMVCLNQGIKGQKVNKCNLATFQRNTPMFIRMMENLWLKLLLWMNLY